ncbi:branched-chain amino acid ABC transporter permease [Petroclostridium sp. X23]|uniref:branched-chain amino acid ABC transporter permease n=1 Tax=Petroclostridium sp. X23 TaxID=3045146 RepID=UPI0024ACDB2B|nr:branched-chain amino acid ABC transporter permease [Petroclostridium sp. X23]WHH57648.1 branched-chain amino acid ABC transporter permease [Petroclostridium sp. X23]
MKKIIFFIGAAFILLLPFIGLGDYILRIAVMAGIYIILALSLNLVTGITGQISLGHAAFYGIGAYTSALLSLSYGISFWVTMPAAVVLASLAGLLIGLPSLKLSGGYLAITTLGFNEIVRLVLINWDTLTRGPMGLPGIPAPNLFGKSLDTNASYFYLILIFVVITFIVMYRILHSKIGRNFLAVREDDIAAEAMGINLLKHKVAAFVIGAAFAGMAGSIYAHYVSYIDPQSFTFDESIIVLSMVIIGGMGNLAGAALGAVIMVILPELLRFLAQYRMLIYGFALVLMMLVRPQGILGNIPFDISFVLGRRNDKYGLTKSD